MKKKCLALLLAALLALAAGASALADYYSGLLPAVRTTPLDFTGKTIILHTNDVHGAIDKYACVPALEDQLLAHGASDVVVVDAGDFSQGNIYVSVNKGANAIELMNAAGYDVVVPGNHEFDFGFGQFMKNLKKAEFTTLCANVFLDETGETAFPGATVLRTDGGVDIGFVGVLSPETATKVNPGLISEISFATFDDLYASAQAAVDEIAGKCDLVIALTHLGVDGESAINGYRSVDLLQRVHGIDFTIDAHSHTVMTASEDGGAVQSAGVGLEYIGVVVIDDATGSVEDNFLLSTADMPMNEEVDMLAQLIFDEVDAAYSAAFATTEVPLDGEKESNRSHETNLGDLVADAILWSVVRENGIEQVEPNAVVSITNGGGIRASIDPGSVTMKDINTTLPFGNTVAVVYVTGGEMLEALEASTFAAPDGIGGYPQTSGITWTLDTTVEYDRGEIYTMNGKDTTYYAPASIRRVTIESVNGEPFDPDATYAVVTNDFCAAGGDTYNAFYRAYSEGAGFDTGIPMDEAVVSYITDALDGRITDGQYGEPRGSETQIPAVIHGPGEVEPAA